MNARNVRCNNLLTTKLYIKHYLLWRYFKLFKNEQYSCLQKIRLKETINGYSFKPFDKNKCIFIHIPKCAGLSISKALFGNLGGSHTNISTYQIVFSPREFHDYFKFTFVRNPWDRLVSAFFFLKSGGFNKEDKKWAQNNIGIYDDFDIFVKKWVNRKNIWLYHHFRPYYYYITSRIYQNPPLDFIGYYENLEHDFKNICDILNINCKLPRLNKSNRVDHLDYYNEETIKIVADAYQKDIELLGYSFDNSSIKTQLLNRSRIITPERQVIS